MDTNEGQRLEAVRRYRILDTDPERAFDALTELASYICKTPIALITLVDTDRQWFKSRVGLDATETSRDIAFCNHAIRQPEMFIVPDALDDDRFRDNPLVASDPRIRFYAGAPLVTEDGYALGTLCVIDRVPRDLTQEQRDALSALRGQVLAQLELRRNLADLRTALEERDRAEADRERLIQELKRSLSHVRKLSGLIPHCSACRFDVTIPADPAKIDTVTDAVMQILQDNGWVAGNELEIETSLRESLANAIRHGCGSDALKQIQCCVALDDSGEVLIVVRDPGSGFDLAAVPDPMAEQNLLKSSGRGIFLINQLMDEVEFNQGGREIRMRKHGRNAE